MRLTRELPLAASLLLTGIALFFGGGPRDGPALWLGAGAALAIVVLVASVGVPGGWPALVPLGALAIWLAVTIDWSSLPDRSWAYADRTVVYVLFAVLGLWLAPRTRELALGLAALLGAVVIWSLAGKVLPVLYDYGSAFGGARLRAPVGLWNQLALLGDFALPLALWRKRAQGVLLAYGWLVALVLTYSRGGLATAVLVVAAWLAFDDDRLESAATLVAAAVPAAVVVGIAFVLPGVTKDAQSMSTRWHDGLIFGAVLLVGAVVAVALERAPRPRSTPLLRRVLLGAGIAVVVAVIVVGAVTWHSFTAGGSVTNSGPERITSTSSNFRLTWWKEALHGFEHHPLGGTGAGSFALTNLRYRASFLDQTTEPHDLPLQFLSEAGIVGAALFVLAIAALVRPGLRRRRHELALALLLPAYLVHSLIDIDWDFVAVSAPAFLAAGAIAGRAPLRRVAPFGAALLAGAALLVVAVLALPWFGGRWANEASNQSYVHPARAIVLANRAHSVDPLLVEPYWAKADAEITRGQPALAFAYFKQAVSKQPLNPQTWLLAGQYALQYGCNRSAYTYLERYTELDQKARQSEGGADYQRALKLVNEGKNVC